MDRIPNRMTWVQAGCSRQRLPSWRTRCAGFSAAARQSSAPATTSTSVCVPCKLPSMQTLPSQGSLCEGASYSQCQWLPASADYNATNTQIVTNRPSQDSLQACLLCMSCAILLHLEVVGCHRVQKSTLNQPPLTFLDFRPPGQHV